MSDIEKIKNYLEGIGINGKYQLEENRINVTDPGKIDTIRERLTTYCNLNFDDKRPYCCNSDSDYCRGCIITGGNKNIPKVKEIIRMKLKINKYGGVMIQELI